MVNYLARLGWSHGDDELFTREQLVQWFDGQHLSKSAAQWDVAKLNWVNAHCIKAADDARLAAMVGAQLMSRGVAAAGADAALQARRCALFKDRCATVVELADWIEMYFVPVRARPEELQPHFAETVRLALTALREKLAEAEWTKAAIGLALKETLAAHGLKMPQLALPLRLLLCGRPQTPSIDAVLELFPRDAVLVALREV